MNDVPGYMKLQSMQCIRLFHLSRFGAEYYTVLYYVFYCTILCILLYYTMYFSHC